RACVVAYRMAWLIRLHPGGFKTRSAALTGGPRSHAGLACCVSFTGTHPSKHHRIHAGTCALRLASACLAVAEGWRTGHRRWTIEPVELPRNRSTRVRRPLTHCGGTGLALIIVGRSESSNR